jgi:hypothetical protein
VKSGPSFFSGRFRRILLLEPLEGLSSIGTIQQVLLLACLERKKNRINPESRKEDGRAIDEFRREQ